jgi:hypothetical protein
LFPQKFWWLFVFFVLKQQGCGTLQVPRKPIGHIVFHGKEKGYSGDMKKNQTISKEKISLVPVLGLCSRFAEGADISNHVL